MDAFTPESVRRFIQFLYTNDYDATNIHDEQPQPAKSAATDETSTVESDSNSTANGTRATVALSSRSTEISSLEARHPAFRIILAHARMNAIGDHYDVPDLVKLANARINTAMVGASPDSPWIIGLPAIAEAALEIANNGGLSEILATAVSKNISTILNMGTLEGSSLMTPFCLELLKKCNAANQALSESLPNKTRTLNKVCTRYRKAADQVARQRKAAFILNTTPKRRCGM